MFKDNHNAYFLIKYMDFIHEHFYGGFFTFLKLNLSNSYRYIHSTQKETFNLNGILNGIHLRIYIIFVMHTLLSVIFEKSMKDNVLFKKLSD